ncbi:MAG: hypothetical protein KJ792_02070, partial [Actinobacteria bacterium]|nr:hypothetical protein [Actinomycetota bacterium]
MIAVLVAATTLLGAIPVVALAPAGDSLPPVEVERPVPVPEPTTTPTSLPNTMTTGVDGNSITASALEELLAAGRVPGAGSGTSPVKVVAPPLVDYVHAEVCGVYSAGIGQGWPCSDGQVLDHSDLCG